MLRPLFLALAALAVTAPAQAGERYETRSERVQIADLDLSTDAGVRELERRVGRAVARICGSDRECREEAWASTWEQANAAIARDEWMRRLAAERAAQLHACGYRGCPPPQPARWRPPPPPGPQVTVIVITTGGYGGYGYPPPPPPPGYWRP